MAPGRACALILRHACKAKASFATLAAACASLQFVSRLEPLSFRVPCGRRGRKEKERWGSSKDEGSAELRGEGKACYDATLRHDILLLPAS